jgi:hypothetical protein
MTCLGVHLALTPDQARLLLAAGDDDALIDVLQKLRAGSGQEWTVSSGRSWDAVHRCLSNGTIYYDEGEYPLNRAVLGGKHLYRGDERVVAYVPPEEVRDVASALSGITELAMRRRYDEIDPDDYDGEHGDSDFRGAWERFRKVRELYLRAAAEGRSVVFAVDL